MFILKMPYRKFDGHTIYHFRIKKLTVIKKNEITYYLGSPDR